MDVPPTHRGLPEVLGASSSLLIPSLFHHGALGATVTLGNWQGRGGAEDPSEGIYEVLDLLTVRSSHR